MFFLSYCLLLFLGESKGVAKQFMWYQIFLRGELLMNHTMLNRVDNVTLASCVFGLFDVFFARVSLNASN